ncbi:hypothetical protein GCM10009830_19180 [Glycomyces endophyticus]|uniref:RNA polymerase sigma-70 region 2 domain-containing protein n=1 Tax=Glycomyces endophyticus TaxID=480996 RepID=A0ABN2GLB2_9ACTN
MHDRSDRPPDAYDLLLPLFGDLARLAGDDPARTQVRERLIVGHLPIAEGVALRFAGLGADPDALLETASVALIHAIDRFDPAEDGDFLAFAVPAITGEVRRHCRDTAWPGRSPHRSRALRTVVGAAAAEFERERGRPATLAELAERLGITETEAAVGLTDPPKGR